MIVKYANYNEQYDDNLLSELVNDLILTLIENDWNEINISTLDNNDTSIIYDDDNELYFEEEYIKYVTSTNIIFLEYMSISRIDIKLKNSTEIKRDFNRQVEDNSWTGNRIIF